MRRAWLYFLFSAITLVVMVLRLGWTDRPEIREPLVIAVALLFVLSVCAVAVLVPVAVVVLVAMGRCPLLAPTSPEAPVP